MLFATISPILDVRNQHLASIIVTSLLRSSSLKKTKVAPERCYDLREYKPRSSSNYRKVFESHVLPSRHLVSGLTDDKRARYRIFQHESLQHWLPPMFGLSQLLRSSSDLLKKNKKPFMVILLYGDCVLTSTYQDVLPEKLPTA